MNDMQRLLLAFLRLTVFTVFWFSVKITASTQTINIAGLFPYGGLDSREASLAGDAVRPAAEMAVEDINNRSNVLPGYRLRLYQNDTEVWWCKALLRCDND